MVEIDKILNEFRKILLDCQRILLYSKFKAVVVEKIRPITRGEKVAKTISIRNWKTLNHYLIIAI